MNIAKSFPWQLLVDDVLHVPCVQSHAAAALQLAAAVAAPTDYSEILDCWSFQKSI